MTLKKFDDVRSPRYPGIALWVTNPDIDGRVGLRMVGDDWDFTLDPDDVEPLEETEYCHDCGQIGCEFNVPV